MLKCNIFCLKRISFITSLPLFRGRQTCKSTYKRQDQGPDHKASVPHMLVTDKHHAQEQEDNGITC